MSINRRDFIKVAGAAGCLASLSGISQLAYGATQGKPLLVTLFLRGGCDGLHLVGPSADPNYIAARPPELRVQENGSLLEHSLDAAAGFRLHPDAAALAELYNSKQLAIVHAVGLTDGTRSHFVAQDLMERGLSDEKRMSNVNKGWLARALANSPGLVPAYSATSAPTFALQGLPSALAAPDISSGLGLPWGAPTAKLLHALAMTGNSPAHEASLAALNVLEAVDLKLPRDANGKVLPYQAAGKANYEGAGDLSRSLASVARLAKMEAGLAAACVDFGGWDTHENQAGRFANQVRQLSSGLAAFHADMAAAGKPVVIVVMTEFGRRLRANKSNGTDHGHGACWLILGDTVRGGRMFGKWPGLATQKLDQGVDLAVTTDYRAVLAESLSACGLAPKESFPEWKSTTPLGLFSAAA